MKPKAYNKQKMIRGMDRAIAKAKSEEEQMFELFFQDDPRRSEGMSHMVKDYVKDHVSKDLNIPWHQIRPEHVKSWKEKGSQPVKFADWWKEPTEVEKKRMLKMLSGASLRKDL
jgi:hypothetical protein